MVDSPSGGAPMKAPRWDLADTEGFGGGNSFPWCSYMFWGYVDIYRRKKYVGGASRGPRGRGRAHHPRGPLMAPMTYFFHPYIPTYPENIQEHHEKLFPPPQPSVSARSHLGAFAGAPPEGESTMEGLYIISKASPMSCE